MLHVINVSIRWLSSMHMESGIIRSLAISIFGVFSLTEYLELS
jgi:hypothetical protein